MIRKLRIKFVVINMTMLSVLLVMVLGLFYGFTRYNLEQATFQTMRSLSMAPRHHAFPNDRREEMQLPYFILYLDSRGRIVDTAGGFYELPEQSVLEAMVEVAKERKNGVLEEQNLRFASFPGKEGTTLVFVDLSSQCTTLRNLLKNAVLVGLLGFAGFLGLSLFLSWWAIRPVDAAWQQQKQFLADASHELKTPLTVIITNAELLQSGEYEQASRETFQESILTMARQMRSLVEQMLELARSDSQKANLTLTGVDLSQLVLQSALSMEALFFERGLVLTEEITPGIRVRGNAQGLQQVTEVLLDNARKYSGSGTEVRLKLAPYGYGRCRLSVESPGKALSAQERKDIFRRFYRMDKARSRDGSFGLGLPIAQSIVVQHHGQIWAESGSGTNTFFVELPLLSEKAKAEI